MKTPPFVVVTASRDYPVAEEVIAETLKGKATYRIIDLPFTPPSVKEEDDLIAKLSGARGFFVRPGIITRRVILGSPQLRIIAVHGAGVDQVDVTAATEAGVIVTNVPGGNANAVAELAIGLMLAIIRRIPQSSWMVQRESQWKDARWMGTELQGKRLGVVGTGNVGKRVIALARAFDMSAVAYDPYVSKQTLESYGAEPADLKTVLRSSDMVTIHVPFTEKTRHLIGESELASMKPGAFLINTSRGPIVDEQALYRSLVNGHLSGAALDVMENEPPTGNNPLLGLQNVVVTPHMAGSTAEALATIARVACQDIVRVLDGEAPRYPVNPEVLPSR